MERAHAEQVRARPSRRRLLKTIIFAAGMAAVLVLAWALSHADRPPELPADNDHRSAVESIATQPSGLSRSARVEKVNAVCSGCHALQDLPPSHPLEHERFECVRCHQESRARAGETSAPR